MANSSLRFCFRLLVLSLIYNVQANVGYNSNQRQDNAIDFEWKQFKHSYEVKISELKEAALHCDGHHECKRVADKVKVNEILFSISLHVFKL